MNVMNLSQSKLHLTTIVFLSGIGLFSWVFLSLAQAPKSGNIPPPKTAEAKVNPSKAKDPQSLVAEAKAKAKEQFLGLQTPSPWQELLSRKLGPVKFDNRPVVEAAKEVARRLNQNLTVKPGIEGTISCDNDGTLNDFIRAGLEPRYCVLSLDESGLLLKPVVMMKGDTVPAERGAYYSEHPEALQEIAAKCGAMKDYAETVGCDASGYLTIRGRVWFIERVRKELKLND